MNRMLFAVAVTLAISAEAFVSAARAQEMRWIGDSYEEGASLIYGIPESDAALLAFHCDRDSRIVAVSLEYEPVDAEDGVEVDVELALLGGSPRVLIRTGGIRLEVDDKFVLEGETELTDTLQQLLASDGTLLVTVEDGAQEIPLAGAREAARHLFAACDPKTG